MKYGLLSTCVQLYDSEGVTILFEKMVWLQAANLKIAEQDLSMFSSAKKTELLCLIMKQLGELECLGDNLSSNKGII